MEHADSQDVLQSTCTRLESACTRLESACTRLQKSGIEFLKRGRRDFKSKGLLRDLWSVFIFLRTFSLIKGSYLDRYHCGEPVISSKCEDTSEEETRERLLKFLFFTDDRRRQTAKTDRVLMGATVPWERIHEKVCLLSWIECSLASRQSSNLHTHQCVLPSFLNTSTSQINRKVLFQQLMT